MYTAVADKYRGDPTALAKLVTKVRAGGTGVWGNVMMPPHPQLTEAQVTQMVAYVLSLGAKKPSGPTLPAKGEYSPPAGPAQGAVVLRAAYTDQGANGLPGATTEQTLVLRAPTIVVATGELGEGVSKMQVPQLPVAITMPNKSGSYSRFKQLDLSGITEVVIAATAPAQYGAVGGKVEVRVDSVSGPLVGETEMLPPSLTPNAPPTQLHAALKATTGMHDVYLVFRNEQAKAQQLLFIVMTATFMNGASPATVGSH
jgi:cytochrome c